MKTENLIKPKTSPSLGARTGGRRPAPPVGLTLSPPDDAKQTESSGASAPSRLNEAGRVHQQHRRASGSAAQKV